MLLFTVLLLLCSCAKNGGFDVKPSPENKTLPGLAATVYTDEQLADIARFEGTLNELNKKFPVECLRELEDGYRASYLGKNSVAVIYFDEKGNKLSGSKFKTLKLKSDFDALTEGQAIDDVQKLAPDGNYLFLYSGRNDLPKISSHYTADGYLISIEYEYDKADNCLKIVKITQELI